jgi:hypothetical protein
MAGLGPFLGIPRTRLRAEGNSPVISGLDLLRCSCAVAELGDFHETHRSSSVIHGQVASDDHRSLGATRQGRHPEQAFRG